MRGKAYLPSNRRRQAERGPRRERGSPLLGEVPAAWGGYHNVTMRIAVITLPRALVVLRSLLNNPRKPLRFRLNRA